MNDETTMSAEDFFGETEKDKTPVRMVRAHGKRSKKNHFAELKVKMVMRIYGVSKVHALEIIAGRAAEKTALEDAKENKRKKAKTDVDELMSAEEFFGGMHN